MSSMTPIKVRGKRRGTLAEKWHSGKRRHQSRNGSPASSRSSAVTDRMSSASRTRKRKRREYVLCRLEELPAEIIQAIFERAANPNLALASPLLATQLSSHHIYHQITSHILHPILGQRDTKASDSELAAATRLLNSRFMTWTFFRAWINHELSRLKIDRGEDDDNDHLGYRRLWCLLEPSSGLMPPAKLLHGPWSDERVHFLNVFAGSIENIVEADPAYGEAAYKGFVDAVAEQSLPALRTLTGMGLQANTELVRQAVVDEGCDHLMVLHLIHSVGIDGDGHPASKSAIDFLDPVLWSWADRARATGNPKGEWLMDLLRGLARESNRPSMSVAEDKDGDSSDSESYFGS